MENSTILARLFVGSNPGHTASFPTPPPSKAVHDSQRARICLSQPSTFRVQIGQHETINAEGAARANPFREIVGGRLATPVGSQRRKTKKTEKSSTLRRNLQNFDKSNHRLSEISDGLPFTVLRGVRMRGPCLVSAHRAANEHHSQSPTLWWWNSLHRMAQRQSQVFRGGCEAGI